MSNEDYLRTVEVDGVEYQLRYKIVDNVIKFDELEMVKTKSGLAVRKTKTHERAVPDLVTEVELELLIENFIYSYGSVRPNKESLNQRQLWTLSAFLELKELRDRFKDMADEARFNDRD